MHKDTSMIVLAAGNSTRMGQCKFLMASPNGKTFIENIILQLLAADLKQIVIVTQAKYIDALYAIFSGQLPAPVQLVRNDFPQYERFYSLQLGIKALDKTDHCFIHNADNPVVSSHTLKQLYANKNEADYIKPRFENRGGHPVLLSKKVLDHLLVCDKTSYLNEELQKHKCCDVHITDDSVLLDIDTKSDYQNYLQHELLRA